MRRQERRKTDPCQTNHLALMGLIALGVSSIIGAFVLAVMRLTVPEFMGSLAIGISGILGGYLNNQARQVGTDIETRNVESVNITNTKPEEEAENVNVETAGNRSG
jgi:uncharacterized membrane protein